MTNTEAMCWSKTAECFMVACAEHRLPRRLRKPYCQLEWLLATGLSLALAACVGAPRPDYSNELAIYRQGQANAIAQCKADSQSIALDPIRDKVHLFDGTNNPPGFHYLSNEGSVLIWIPSFTITI